MAEERKSLNFIETIIEEYLEEKGVGAKIHTRFPPEPNGYLHIGHAKSICLNFGLARQYKGLCNLRFDDTNPAKEEQEYVDAIKEDIHWLGFQWDGEACFTSDYFQQLYDWAIMMIKQDKAYVDDQTAEEIAEQKKSPTEPGIESPYRNRSVAENLDLFERMKNGEFPDGSRVLRAKIDMGSPNMHMRDPIMYRILRKSHHRTGDTWCIYPMYDYAHGQSDYLENITHSICTLEFEVHRPLYNWFLEQIKNSEYQPIQREFARLNLSYTIMSKRKLLQLVTEQHVAGWDDPRMPTISGMRRRGYTPAAIRKFADTIGVAKRENVIDVALLEHCVREDLNKITHRMMVVTDPVKIILTNYPEGKSETVYADNNPEDENAGKREMTFARELYIERSDFMEEAPKKYFRLSLGNEVRLKHGYIIKAESVVKDENGEILEIHCSYDTDSKSGSGTQASKRRVKGTLHWVAAQVALPITIRYYDRLFSDEAPDGHKDKDFLEFLNPDSLEVSNKALAEPALKNAKPEDKFQFQRMGYFCVDKDSTPQQLVFNRTITLKDTWAKMQNKK